MKRIIIFLILPICFIATRIQYVDSINQVLSYLLFVAVDFILSIGFYLVFNKKIKEDISFKNVIFTIAGLTALDQILKVLIFKCNLNFNIVGKLFRIKQTKNMHQTAIFNFLDIKVDTYLIILLKIIVFAVVLLLFLKIKNKSKDCICAFILLLAAAFATIIDSICWGYTLDYFYFSKLTCYDLKDFYTDTAIGYSILALFFNEKDKV